MDQYLILHKVRGEPAFDIAEMMEVEDEAWWIIPTSGHRAYPYKYWPLTDVCVHNEFFRSVTNFTDGMPKDLPDHYACNDHNVQPKAIDVMKMVLEAFGQKIKRRL